MSNFKYCILKYGDLSSDEEKKLRTVFPKFVKFDPTIHPFIKAPEELGDYEVLSLNVKPGFFGKDSEDLKYFKDKKWDNFILIYAYTSRKFSDFVVSCQFKVRNLPLDFDAKSDFLGKILDTSNTDNEIATIEPQTLLVVKSAAVESTPLPNVVEVKSEVKLQDNITKLSEDYENNMKELTSAKVKQSKTDAELAKLRDEKAALLSKVALFSALELELSKLKQEKVTAEEKSTKLDDVVKSLELEKQRTSALASQVADHANVKSECSKVKESLDKVTQELTKKTEEHNLLKDEKEKLKQQLELQIEEVKKAAEFLVQVKEHKELQDKECAKFKEHDSKRVNEILTLRTENVKLRSQIELLNEQLRVNKLKHPVEKPLQPEHVVEIPAAAPMPVVVVPTVVVPAASAPEVAKKKLSDLPYNMIKTEMTHTDGKISIKYLNLNTLEREETFFVLGQDPAKNAITIRHANETVRKFDNDVKLAKISKK
jgi:myosin heavy subunit